MVAFKTLKCLLENILNTMIRIIPRPITNEMSRLDSGGNNDLAYTPMKYSGLECTLPP